MKKILFYICLMLTGFLSITLILILLEVPILQLYSQFANASATISLNRFIGIGIIALTFMHTILTMKYHELAHWEEASKYHTLINPKITNSHFDCDNWQDFVNEKENIRKIAMAGILFDIKNNITGLILSFFEPWTIPCVMIFLFGNAIPIKFSKYFATDGYWSRHTEEFMQSKL